MYSLSRLLQRNIATLLLTAVLLPAGIAGAAEPHGEPARADNPGAANNNPIKIGIIYSFTKSSAHMNQQLLDGTNLFFEEVHHKLAGHPVQVVVINDEMKPSKAVLAFHQLVEKDKVAVVGGVLFVPILAALAPLAASEHMPLVTVSTADMITQRGRNPWVIRTTSSASQPEHVLGDYASRTLHMKKMATIGLDFAFGYETVGGFQAGFELAGGQIVQKLWISFDGGNIASVLQATRKDVDGIFLNSNGFLDAAIAKELLAAGIKCPILTYWGDFRDPEFLTNYGKNFLGALSTGVYDSGLESAANKQFVSRYKEKYGVPPTAFAEWGYVNAKWIGSAISSLNGSVDDKSKLMTALRNVKFTDAPRGPIKLDEFGNPTENVYIAKLEQSDGKLRWVSVYTYPSVSQFWKWKPDEFLQQPPYSKQFPPCTHCN